MYCNRTPLSYHAKKHIRKIPVIKSCVHCKIYLCCLLYDFIHPRRRFPSVRQQILLRPRKRAVSEHFNSSRKRFREHPDADCLLHIQIAAEAARDADLPEIRLSRFLKQRLDACPDRRLPHLNLADIRLREPELFSGKLNALRKPWFLKRSVLIDQPKTYQLAHHIDDSRAAEPDGRTSSNRLADCRHKTRLSPAAAFAIPVQVSGSFPQSSRRL